MSDYNALRPPSTGGPLSSNQPHGSHHSMGSAPIGRASSPLSANNPGRYSLGGANSKTASTPSDNMLRKAQQQSDLMRSPVGNNSFGSAGAAGLSRFGPRPSSEMLGTGQAGFNASRASTGAEQDAIDKWFEDLQHYEATLEEMATASLDANFKEELSAIEQWFRVLSEPERTAALYSLLQESTQVQIRFFITVLQQMARSDPMSALLSPSASSTMQEQMEAKMASLGIKSPTAMKTPGGSVNSPQANRSFHRQSDAFLSPNAAQMNFSPGVSNSDAAAMLAAQRAKLKANRVSAPGTFTGDQRNFGASGGLDQVQERGSSPQPNDRSRSPGPDTGAGMRPKSIDALGSALGGGPKSPRRSGPLDDQLSPVPSGNWSSMVNTPLNNMFDDVPKSNVNLDAASSQLAGLTGNPGNVQLDQDVTKYQRRRNGQEQPGGANSSPSMGSNAGGQWSQQPDYLRQTSPNLNQGNGQFSQFPTMSPNSFAGLLSPSGGFGNGMNLQMMNAMAAMGGNLNNANAAQFMAMQQQILQNQQTIAAMAAAQQQQQRGGGMSGSGQQQRGMGGQSGMQNTQQRRSPAPANTRLAGLPGSATRAGGGASAAGAGAGSGGGDKGEEEVPDISILSDVPAWLRHLRLHKYTPNFETSNWKDMVVMTDSDLEAKGVAALGARRKLLKTFRAVREKHGIKGADDAEKPGDGLKGGNTAGADDGGIGDKKAEGSGDGA